MSNRKKVKTTVGYVVDHKTSEVRYAVSPQNFNPKVHTKVRELEQHETVHGFRPKRVKLADQPQSAQTSPEAPSPEDSQNNTK